MRATSQLGRYKIAAHERILNLTPLHIEQEEIGQKYYYQTIPLGYTGKRKRPLQTFSKITKDPVLGLLPDETSKLNFHQRFEIQIPEREIW